jgi:Probable Zinc-ribbon domain
MAPRKKRGDFPLGSNTRSSKRAWWQCQANPEHVWDAVIYTRTSKKSNQQCPFCSGARINKSNSLAECHPNIAKEWHPNRNSPLTPTSVKRASGKNVWWQCADDPEHEWQAVVKNRTVLGTSCPHCSGKNGARRLQEHLLEAALLNKDSYQIFSESMGNLKALAKIPFSGPSRSNHLFNRMLYSSAITTLETYLSDAFCQTVIHDEKLRTKLLRTSPDMKDRRFDIDDVLQWNGRIDEMVSQYLLDIVWHNLAKIRPMFANVLSVQFPTDSASVHRAVATRHDIVHRNGRRKDGSVLVIRDSDLVSCFDAVSSFAEFIENQLKVRLE